MIKIRFSENLRELRTAKKLSQAELGKLVGVDQRTISGWEKGVSEPSFASLALLCEIFDETFDGLITDLSN